MLRMKPSGSMNIGLSTVVGISGTVCGRWCRQLWRISGAGYAGSWSPFFEGRSGQPFTKALARVVSVF